MRSKNNSLIKSSNNNLYTNAATIISAAKVAKNTCNFFHEPSPDQDVNVLNHVIQQAFFESMTIRPRPSGVYVMNQTIKLFQ